MALSIAEKKRLKSRYGPWALVTGATSGIGLELATRLAESGLHLLINSRRQDELDQVSQHLTQQYGIQCRTIAADMADEAGVARVLDATNTVDLGLAVLSAGYGTSGSFVQGELRQEVNMLRVNCEAVLILSHALGRRFAQRRRGGLILMSSLVGFQGVPFAAHYAATKAYVQSLAEAIALELKPFGVDVLAAAPGPVQSGFGTRADMRMNMSLTPAQVGTPILRALGRQHTVLPGWLSKLLVWSLSTAPRALQVRIMQQVMGGMTAHQRSI